MQYWFSEGFGVGRLSIALFVSVVLAMPPVPAEASAPKLVVASLFRDNLRAPALTDVSLRTLAGGTLRRGVNLGEVLPAEFRIEIPARETVVIAFKSSTATLAAGSVATFAYAGAVESVAVTAGKAFFDDVLDFYRVSGESIVASQHGTKFWVGVNSKAITITCTDGAVDVIRSGASGTGPKEQGLPFVEQVDFISGRGVRSVTY